MFAGICYSVAGTVWFLVAYAWAKERFYWMTAICTLAGALFFIGAAIKFAVVLK